MMRRRSILGILAAVNALVAVALAIAVNVATHTLPRFLDQHPGRAWALVGMLTVVTIVCAIAAVRVGQADGTQIPSDVQVKGIHAGGDLKVHGQRHSIVGGDQIIITPRSELPDEPKRRSRT